MPLRVPQNPKAERHLRHQIGQGRTVPARLQVPQNPKAERHLRLVGQELSRARNNSSPEPKSRKAFETECQHIAPTPGLFCSPEPKSRKAFETVDAADDADELELSSPEPKSRKAFETRVVFQIDQQARGSPEPKSRKAFETEQSSVSIALFSVPQNPKAERHLRPDCKLFQSKRLQ